LRNTSSLETAPRFNASSAAPRNGSGIVGLLKDRCSFS